MVGKYSIMTKRSRLLEMMGQKLPSIKDQKRLIYRTSYNEVMSLFRLINRTIFNDRLEIPEIEISSHCRGYWGLCIGMYEKPRYRRSYCKIKLSDKWFCKQWLITMLAHEMCHQYQWEVYSEKRARQGKDRILSHGKSFFIFKDKLARHGISLKTATGTRKWFKTQDLFKA